MFVNVLGDDHIERVVGEGLVLQILAAVGTVHLAEFDVSEEMGGDVVRAIALKDGRRTASAG